MNIKKYINTLNIEYQKYKRISFSQDGEDLVLWSFIQGNRKITDGFYVDFGALHPFRFSNTMIFYRSGWKGINVDATPGSMRLFNKYRPRDINVESVLSDVDGESVVYYCFKEPALNTFDQELAQGYIDQGFFLEKEISLKTVSANTILRKYVTKNDHINFITIDCEGLDYRIVTSIDLSRFAPDYFVVEDFCGADSNLEEYINKSVMHKYLVSQGYVMLSRLYRSVIYRKSCL